MSFEEDEVGELEDLKDEVGWVFDTLEEVD